MNLKGFNGKLIMLIVGEEIPATAKVTTLVSIVNSPALKVVKANLPVGRLLSDAEVFGEWKKQKGVQGVAEVYGVPAKMLLDIGQMAPSTPYRAYPASWRK